MKSPQDLIHEAEQAEAVARTVSYAKDKAWLLAKAKELRHQADRLKQLARREGEPPPKH